MKELIERASATGSQFEIYSRSEETRSVSIENSEFKSAEVNLNAGVGLRLIKDGLIGSSFTTNLSDPGLLVDNAMASLNSGVAAGISFSGRQSLPAIRTYSEKAEEAGAEELLSESFRIKKELEARSSAQINVTARTVLSESRLVNSSGLDFSWKESQVEKNASLITAGGSDCMAADVGFELAPMRNEALDEVCEAFKACANETRPATGKHKVLFMPRAMEVLLWRFRSGSSAQSLYQNISPLVKKVGEKIFSEILTIKNSALDDSLPGARVIDDEGVPCSDFTLVENGVLKGFYSDLKFAAKTGMKPTGHGFRRSPWGGNPILMPVLPYLSHVCVERGNKTFSELLKEMGDGLVVFGALGAHTGNIPNGDFSIGLSMGLCVEKGRITGKAKDTMVSGNIYDILKRAVAVGSECDPAYGNNPPLLLDGVDVSS